MRTRKRRPPAIIEYLFKPSPKVQAATEGAIGAVMGGRVQESEFPSRVEILAEFSAAQRRRA